MECVMRGLVPYILGGVLVVLALDFIAPPVGLSLAFGTWPTAGASPSVSTPAPLQQVDRTHKADRLDVTTTIGKRQPPAASPVAVEGCEPSFSPLTAKATVAGRCMV
jgi:hypothetical protein